MLLFKWRHVIQIEVPEMEMIIKLFLLLYLLAMVLVTVLSVIWVLTVIFAPDLGVKKTLSTVFNKIKNA